MWPLVTCAPVPLENCALLRGTSDYAAGNSQTLTPFRQQKQYYPTKKKHVGHALFSPVLSQDPKVTKALPVWHCQIMPPELSRSALSLTLQAYSLVKPLQKRLQGGGKLPQKACALIDL